MRSPPSRSGSGGRGWLAPKEGGERAGWFGLLREDQLVRLGDLKPVLLAAVDDHDLAPPAEDFRAAEPDHRGARRRFGGPDLRRLVDHPSRSLICWARQLPSPACLISSSCASIQLMWASSEV